MHKPKFGQSKPFLQVALLALLVLGAIPLALAWSALGHRLVGALAQPQLTPAAQAQVELLLAGEPDPTLAGVASWADDLRRTDPERFKLTSRWHYVNTPPGSCIYVASLDCPDGNCVVAAIQKQTAILADRSQPLAARRDALKFVVHFVGDVHQPMHANNRDDKGGNAFQISLRTDLKPEAYARKHYIDGVMGTNLHAVWDYYILGSAGHGTGGEPGLDQYAAQLGALPWPPMDTDGPNTDAIAWAAESCRLVDSHHLYPDTHKMDRSYLDAQRPLAEQRVRRAAWRLAQLLNQALG